MFNLLNFSYILPFIKIIFLILDFMLVVFLVIVLKQVFSMNTIVNDSNDSLSLKLGAFILFIIAVSLFVATLVIL